MAGRYWFALLWVFLVAATRGSVAAESPNIVLIIGDDQAWTDYSFMGHPTIRTPRIDRLARESLACTHGYVPSSLCCPSLASIITGLYAHQHQVTSNDPPLPQGMKPREFHASAAFRQGRETMSQHLEQVATLPRLLQERGYLSLQTGKWWQGNFRRGGFTHGMTRGDRHGDDGLEIGRKTMQPIYDFIRTAGDEHKPFFVWYAPLMPHDPHTPPERLLDYYRQKVASPHVARYQAMVEWFDETVGQLLDHLEEKKLAENTIVVFLADNGWIQNPEAARYAPKSKQSQYDGGLRTPILVRWPGHVAPRTVVEPVLSIDIVPTLLAAIGQAPPAESQGINLLDEAAIKARRAIHGECFTHNAVDLNHPAANLRWRWMIEDGWKLIVPSERNEPDQPVELYDLAHDPQETNNLAGQESGRVAAMREGLDRWWNPEKE